MATSRQWCSVELNRARYARQRCHYVRHRFFAHTSYYAGDEGAPINARHRLPPTEDHAAWTALKEVAAASYAQTIVGAAGDLSSEVLTVLASGATIHVATPQAPNRGDDASQC